MTSLQKAAQAVIDRWDSPAWKDQPHTANYIAELRKALDAEIAQAVEPVAWTWDTSGTGGVMEGFVEAHFAFNKPHPDKRILNLTPLYLHPPQPQATTAVPEGYVLVPVELHTATRHAFLEGQKSALLSGHDHYEALHVGWRAKLAAAQGEKP